MSSFRLLAKTEFVLFLALPLTIGSSGASASDNQGGGDQGGSRSWRTALEDRGIAFSVESDTDVSSYVGDLAGVNNNAAYNSFRLYELWVEKGFKVGPFVGLLKAGLLSADQEFDLIDAASFFINSSFAADLAFGGSVPIPICPFNALAARLKLSAGDEHSVKATFRSGVFDGNSATPKLGPFALDAPTQPSYNKYGVGFHLNPIITF